ncbi:MAG: amidohydrolase [Mycobacteriales bacterium]|nr:amidohydrolase [Frankia sp.]
MKLELDEFVAAHEAELIGFRRDLHAHPELGWTETRTTELLAARLRAAGLSPTPLPRGCGLTCDLGSGDPVVALRADIDALPLPDAKDVSYRSTVAGLCHACGHDVHATVVLGAGLALAAQSAALPGTVRLVFQPAEEQFPGGALDVISAGRLDGVRAIYAVHCSPSVATGTVGLRTGPVTGAADQIEVRLRGPGGHTARPHLAADLVWLIARVVTEVPAGMSRLVDPRAGLSVVWGHVSGGNAPNAIPQAVTARGTVRMLDHDVWDAAPKLVEQVVESIVSPYGAEWELDYKRGVPPVCNDATATAVMSHAISTALGERALVQSEQSLGGEDFAWYLEHVPGAMARLGTKQDGVDVDLHSPSFDVDERAIAVGLRLLAQTAVDALDHYRDSVVESAKP